MRTITIILFSLFALVSCNKEKGKTVQHDHDHGTEKLLITEYTSQYELFAEADPFVAGKKSEILAHFTQLSQFKPLEEGSVTLSLIIGSKGVRQTIEKPLKKGIFFFVLKPGISGKGKLIFDINQKGQNHKIVSEIEVYDNEHDAIHEAGYTHIENVNGIVFTKEQSWKIDFETLIPQKENFGKIINSTGSFQSLPGNEIIVVAKSAGIVQLYKNILEGDIIKKGDVLLNILANGLANNNPGVLFIEAQNNYKLAKANYERKAALVQEQIVSEKELEQAKAEFENAKATYTSLEKNFSKNGQIVKAPQSGFIKHVHVNNGQYVNEGDILYSVMHNNKYILKAEVQQKYYPLLSYIHDVNIKSATTGKIYTLKELNGKILSYGKSINSNESYLIPVHMEIENNDSFLEGSFVELYIKTKENKKSMLIPNTGIIEEQSNFFVFVQLTPELFEKREVKTGGTDGLSTKIISGLAEGERIVSKGAVIVKLAAVSNSLDPHAGHVH